ncbi:hypothetical protein [Lysobacter silvisoli]|uniref:DUF5348 domain-containing protein n=1 Tax=Lysobacter silvisoli TaxID=2293254 RepID=A0A371JWX5_9GAMM|nr:hypothetical protein [Lysobacter silvisoli]RDZ26166.1 hypothetical protein DX914_18000 [Lysobacter silvisoli]
MKYKDGTDIAPGDILSIDGVYRGKVIASMDTGRYLPGEESWSYLLHSIMVDTDFAGLVYYTHDACDELELLRRP